MRTIKSEEVKSNPAISSINSSENMDQNKECGLHIYVHVPFCASICSYCAFSRSANTKAIERWLFVIEKEICKILEKEKEKAVRENRKLVIETLYFGGGTPSILKEEQFQRLAAPFVPFLDEHWEWTVEANPESITKEKLAIWKKMQVNRLSVGIQTFDDLRLEKIGRKHTAQKAREAIALAKEAGFKRISADWMFAFPDQTKEELKKDLQEFLALELDHYSIYSLQIEENSVFGKEHLKAIDEDQEAEYYEWIVTSLKEHGFMHYEISSFARNNQVSRHNLSYWQDEDFIGIGYGAWGKEGSVRYTHTDSLNAYLNGKTQRIEEEADPAFEAIMMGLRTVYGCNIQKWQNRYHKNFEECFYKTLHKYEKDLVIQDGCLKVNEHGMEILNSILVDFLTEWEDGHKAVHG